MFCDTDIRLTVSVGHVGCRLCPAAPAIGSPLVARCFGDAASCRAGGRSSDLRTTTSPSWRLHRQLLFIFVSLLLHLVLVLLGRQTAVRTSPNWRCEHLYEEGKTLNLNRTVTLVRLRSDSREEVTSQDHTCASAARLNLTLNFLLCLFFDPFSTGQMILSAFTHSSYLWSRHTCQDSLHLKHHLSKHSTS